MNDSQADVCLILEGTYPYVQGGVSSWVHQIITELKEIRFALLFLGSTPEQTAKSKYQLPPNVVSLSEVYLFDRLPPADLKPGRPNRRWKARFYELLEAFYRSCSEEERLATFWKILDHLQTSDGRFTFGNLCHDYEAWELVCSVYEAFAPQESFLDFFWTARFLHLPLWILIQALPRVPKAALYHSPSTGYAGTLAAIASRTHNVPLLITEHGIYVKERIAEISQASWIYDNPTLYLRLAEGLSPFKQMWVNLFRFLGALSYRTAGRVIALYQGITALQIAFGAAPERISVIPNGIDPARFDQAFSQRRTRLEASLARPELSGITVGFIGRVVPIKDVKTLIRAAHLLVEKRPGTRFEIIGPMDEDPPYFAECAEMVNLLHLGENIRFLGSQKITEVMTGLDVVLLTSISEGLPLIILEAFSAGIPVVATDVGACRELIFGRTPADKALGRAGSLTPICSPQETADALSEFVSQPELLLSMGQAGRNRVEAFYRQKDIIDQYRALYTDLSWSAESGRETPQKLLSSGPRTAL